MNKSVLIVIILLIFVLTNVTYAEISTTFYSGFDYSTKTKSPSAKTLSKNQLKGVREFFIIKYERLGTDVERIIQVAHVVNVQYIINKRVPETKPVQITKPLYTPLDIKDPRIEELLSERSYRKVDDDAFPIDELFKEEYKEDVKRTYENVPQYELQLSYPNSELPLYVHKDEKNAPLEMKYEDFSKHEVILRDYVNYKYNRTGKLVEERAYAGDGTLWYITEYKQVPNSDAHELHQYNFFFTERTDVFYVDAGKQEVNEWDMTTTKTRIKKYDQGHSYYGIPYKKKRTIKKEKRVEGDIIREVKVTYTYTLLNASNSHVKKRKATNCFTLGKSKDISFEKIKKYFSN